MSMELVSENGNYFYEMLEETMEEDELDELSVEGLLYHCKLLLRPDLHRHFPSILEENELGRFDNAIRTYAVIDRDQERPLLLFDNTIFSSGKDGFLVTDKHLYMKGRSTIAWKNVQQIECGSNHITINKQRMPLTWSVLSVQDIRMVEQLLKFCCMALMAYAMQTTDSDSYEEFMSEGKIIIETEAEAIDYSSRLLAAFADSGWSRHVFGLSPDPKVIKKMGQAVQSYAQLLPGEIPLIVYDNTAFGSGKDGCLLTNKRICIKNPFAKPQSYSYYSVSVIELRGIGKDLFINGFEVAVTMLTSDDAKIKFCAMLNRMRNDLAEEKVHGEEGAAAEGGGFSYPRLAKSLLERSILGSDLSRKLFLYEKGAKNEKKFQNAFSAYAALQPDEIPMFLYDDTAFGSAKQGLLASSEALYIRNTMSQGVRFRWGDIHTIELRGAFSKELFINNYKVDATLLSSNDSKGQLCGLLNEIWVAVK
ncbi:hypothetical protein ACTHPF_21425 [Paenibacillus sp. SAF-054]|uniref:hypothetical protein n=1 Tax=unclassified Paenibacillus TaxID=185978 RepID=UPI003F7DF3C8